MNVFDYLILSLYVLVFFTKGLHRIYEGVCATHQSATQCATYEEGAREFVTVHWGAEGEPITNRITKEGMAKTTNR